MSDVVSGIAGNMFVFFLFVRGLELAPRCALSGALCGELCVTPSEAASLIDSASDQEQSVVAASFTGASMINSCRDRRGTTLRFVASETRDVIF